MARIAFGGALVLIALLFLGFVVFATMVTRDVARESVRADAVVALTGGSRRIREAADLLASGRARRLLVSGVNRITTTRDIRALTGLPRRLFACCVDIGYDALNTRGNADETRAWLVKHQFRSLIIVTASYHMPRSLVELSRKLPGVQLYAHPVTPKGMLGGRWWTDADQIRVLGREYLKFLPAAAMYCASAALNATQAKPVKPSGAESPAQKGPELNLSSGQM
ncbi:MAG: YdcF family protein [Pseudomonadota bacterium]